MSQELLPCPFCGVRLIPLPQSTGLDWARHEKDDDCPMSGRSLAIPTWNRRAPDAAREKRMREVAARLKEMAKHPSLTAWRYDLEAEAAKLLEGIGAETKEGNVNDDPDIVGWGSRR